MSFLNPLALWFGLLAIPIIILYLLKIRRKEVDVSSTLLWRMALRDKQANAPWQKLRRNLLLLLQLVILSALVLAGARLAFPVPSIASGSVVLLIDGSASMQARDPAPTRFDRAIDIAQDLVRETGPNTTASAVLITHQPQILFAGEPDRNRAIALLDGAVPSLGEADWPAALSLAAGLVGQGGDTDLTYVLISDGGLPDADLPPLPGLVQYVSVGESGDNLAVSALAARSLPSGDSAELFVGATNYGPEERAALLTIYRDAEPIFTDQLRLPARERIQLVFEDLDPSAGIFEARLSNIQANLALDPFPLDDAGFATLVPPPVRRVLLVSAGNLFLERLLLLLPNLEASKTVPDENGEIQLPSKGFDLYIFDGLLPGGELPPGQVLLVNPPVNPFFSVGETTDLLENARVTEHPLAQFLEWEPVHVYLSQLIEAPIWAQVLVETDATPLVFVGETGGRRIAVVAFDLHDSDLPLQVAFPILFANLFEFLAPHGMISNPNGARPNEAVGISPGTSGGTVTIQNPAGDATTLETTTDEILYTGTGLPGFYNVRNGAGSEALAETFAINLFSPSESDIQIREEVRLGQTTVQITQEDEVSSRESWQWLLLLALAFLVVEWLAYHRRLG